MEQPNCPFYGHQFYPTRSRAAKAPPFILFDSRGNQCALIVDAFSPCKLEIDGRPIDWTTCPRVGEVRAPRR